MLSGFARVMMLKTPAGHRDSFARTRPAAQPDQHVWAYNRDCKTCVCVYIYIYIWFCFGTLIDGNRYAPTCLSTAKTSLSSLWAPILSGPREASHAVKRFWACRECLGRYVA